MIAPVPVTVLASVAFNTIVSAVMVIAPEPDAMVLPAPAVCVKVPPSPVPAVRVMAALAAAVERAPLRVMSPSAPGWRMVTGSVKVALPMVVSPVPSERPMVMLANPS